MLSGIEQTDLAYAPGDPPTPVTTAITVSDAPGTNLTGAQVWISGNYQSGEDILSFSNTANITGDWNAALGVLTLTGSGTPADYQAALQAVTYYDDSLEPSSLVRTVSFQFSDAQGPSNVLTRQIDVAGFIDPPAGDVVRIVGDATNPGYVDVFVNNSTGTPSYTAALPRGAGSGQQWVLYGGTGTDQLIVDFSQGSPLPAGGLVFDGGSSTSGNSLVILGISGGDTLVQNGSQVTVDGSAPISYGNVGLFGFGTPIVAGDGSSGGTVVTQGTLQVTSSDGLPSGGSLTVGGGGTFLFTGAGSAVEGRGGSGEGGSVGWAELASPTRLAAGSPVDGGGERGEGRGESAEWGSAFRGLKPTATGIWSRATPGWPQPGRCSANNGRPIGRPTTARP